MFPVVGGLMQDGPTVEWGEVPRAGRWLEEAGRNADDGLTMYRMCLQWVTWLW
jgi:hypothetical protein